MNPAEYTHEDAREDEAALAIEIHLAGNPEYARLLDLENRLEQQGRETTIVRALLAQFRAEALEQLNELD